MFGEKSFIKDRRYETFNIGLIQVIRDELGHFIIYLIIFILYKKLEKL